MDNSILIVDMPKLNDADIIKAHKVLQSFVTAFESHYLSQLRRYYSSDVKDDDMSDIV